MGLAVGAKYDKVFEMYKRLNDSSNLIFKKNI